MAANGSQLNPLTENAANVLNPAWSPDGTQIAFHSDRAGNGEIYVMNDIGTSQQNKTRRKTTCLTGSPTPDTTLG